jgi:carboxymethylenebutenolidase
MRMKRGAMRAALLGCFLVTLSAAGQTNPDLPKAGQEERAEVVDYRVGQETLKATAYVPPGKGPSPALLILHGDFGATAWVKMQAKRLAKLGYVTLTVDLYRGKQPKDIEEAHILDRGLDEAKVLAELKAALDALTARPDVIKTKIGVLGFDMGGGYGLDLAIADPRVRATILCYGRVTTDPAKLQSLRGPVLGVFAGKDAGISRETREQFAQAMKKAGKQLTLHVAADSDTAFLDPSSPYTNGQLDEAAVAAAWRRMEAFLAETLTQSR